MACHRHGPGLHMQYACSGSRAGCQARAGGRTLAGPGRGLVVAAHEQVAADQLALRARLAVRTRNAVNAVVPYRLVLARRVRAALLLRAETLSVMPAGGPLSSQATKRTALWPACMLHM